MSDLPIPTEAVRALRAALTACDCDKCLCDMIRAALNAWPGMWEAVNGAVILPSNPEKETSE